MNTYRNNRKKTGSLLLAIFATPMLALAQETAPTHESYFSNALFNTLLVTIIILAILVVALSNVLKNISNSELLNSKSTNNSENKSSSSGKIGVILLFLLMSSINVFGQNSGTSKINNDRIGGMDQLTFYLMVCTIALELIVVLVLIYTLKYLLHTNEIKKPQVANKPKEKTILDVLSDAVEVENEESILLDHDYDGIKELDNNLPPWWKYGFYLTIVVAIMYLINYHITKTAPLQAEEYKLSIKKAEAEVAEFMKTSANNVDETTVTMLNSTSDLAAGKDIFISTCSACHGKLGEGTVGPNLTDDYWIHSGSLKEIFKTIKYGYPDKGMKSWKEDFSPIQIAQVSSFIKTLRGTNPPKPKDKQGDLYVEGPAISDSSSVVNDSLKVVAIADTLKK